MGDVRKLFSAPTLYSSFLYTNKYLHFIASHAFNYINLKIWQQQKNFIDNNMSNIC